MTDLSSDHLINTLFESLNCIESKDNRLDIAEKCLLALLELIHAAKPRLSVPAHVYKAILDTMLDLHDQETKNGKNKPPVAHQIAAGLLHEAARFLVRKKELGGKGTTTKEAAAEIARHLRKHSGNHLYTADEIYNKIRTNQKHLISGREIQSDIEFEAAIETFISFSNTN
jgi:hypothetical protein